jgi:hypothetical protein
VARTTSTPEPAIAAIASRIAAGRIPRSSSKVPSMSHARRRGRERSSECRRAWASMTGLPRTWARRGGRAGVGRDARRLLAARRVSAARRERQIRPCWSGSVPPADPPVHGGRSRAGGTGRTPLRGGRRRRAAARSPGTGGSARTSRSPSSDLCSSVDVRVSREPAGPNG